MLAMRHSTPDAATRNIRKSATDIAFGSRNGSRRAAARVDGCWRNL